MATSPIALTFSHISIPEVPKPASSDSLPEDSGAAAPTHDVLTDGKNEAGTLERELSRIDTAEFPTAFPLAMITIALMLSVFLCALGMFCQVGPADLLS